MDELKEKILKEFRESGQSGLSITDEVLARQLKCSRSAPEFEIALASLKQRGFIEITDFHEYGNRTWLIQSAGLAALDKLDGAEKRARDARETAPRKLTKVLNNKWTVVVGGGLAVAILSRACGLV